MGGSLDRIGWAAARLQWLRLPVASAAIAAALSVAFHSFWLAHGVDSLVVVAVIVTALYGGFRPAVVTLVLAAAVTSVLPEMRSMTVMEVVGILLLGIPVAAIGASARSTWHRADRAARAAELALARADEERQASRRSAQLVTSVVQSTLTAVFVKDAADLRYVLVNRAAEELLGRTQPELVGKTDLEVFPRALAEHFRSQDREVVATLRPLEVPEVAVQIAGRGTRHLHTRIVPILDDYGVPIYLVGTAEDITDRLRAREDREQRLAAERAARQEAEAAARRLAALLDLAEGAAEHTHLDRLLSYLARKLAAMFEVDAVAVLLLTPDERDIELRAAFGLEDILRQGLRFPADRGLAGRTLAAMRPLAFEDVAALELPSPLLRQKGIRSVLAAPLKLETKALGVVHVATLTTRQFSADEAALLQIVAIRIAVVIERARLYEAERRAAERAESAIRARDELLATVSHDLRNPLSAVSLGAAALRSHLAGEVSRDVAEKSVQIIERTTGRMTRLIEDLLDASRLESTGFALEWTRNDARALADEALEAVHPLAVEKSLRLVQLVDHGLEPIVCDRERVLQVLSNLLGNAIKFTAVGGTVTLRAEPAQDEVVFSVDDTGPGIDPEQLPRVFERRWQAQGGGRDGSGLGLYIAKGIVDAHGGRIWAQSTPGVGSTFYFALPREPRPRPAQAAPRGAERPGAESSARRPGEPDPPPGGSPAVSDLVQRGGTSGTARYNAAT